MPYDIADAARWFSQDGFVILDGFLSVGELKRVESELARFTREVLLRAKREDVIYEPGSDHTIQHLSGLQRYDDFWKNFLFRRETLDLVGSCLDRGVESGQAELFYKPARVGSSSSPHQDNAYLYLRPPEAAAVWIALDTSTVEKGCIWYVKGSHKMGDLPHVGGEDFPFSKTLRDFLDPEQYPEVPAIMRPGDAVIHHALTVHRSESNRTDWDRRGLVLNYKSIHAQVDKRALADLDYGGRFHEGVKKDDERN